MPGTTQAAVSVLFVSATADKLGGGQVSLLELLGVLDRERFAPIGVVSSAGEMAAAFAALDVPATVIEMPEIRVRTLGKVLAAVRELVRLVRAEGAGLIHANDPRAYIYAGAAARWAGIPSVFHYRVSYSDGIYDRIIPRLCSKIVAVSRSVAGRFPRFARKTCVIENGVDMERFRRDIGSDGLPAALRDKTFAIGTVGRLERAKGIHTFIECVAILERTHADIGAVIVGKDGGEGREMVELCARLGVSDAVVFQDSADDVASLLAALDVYVLLSDNEGLNRTIIEAMSCETPVVATAVGGNPEIIDDPEVGRLVPFDDAPAAAAAIAALLDDPDLRRDMGQRARRAIAARFSLVRHKERMEALFASLLSG